MKKAAVILAAVIGLCAGGAVFAADAPSDQTPPDQAAPDQTAPVDQAAPADQATPADQAAPDQAPEAEAEPAPPPTPKTMLRQVRMGAKAVHRCTKADELTVDNFNQCVTDALADADEKGLNTESYQLGAQYRAWAFMGEHAGKMYDRGEEWSKDYRAAGKVRDTYRKSVADLEDRTGLSEKQICDAVDVTDCSN